MIDRESREHPLLGERIEHARWPNGFQLWLCPRSGRTVSLQISVEAGSLDRHSAEGDLPAGLAHFLEHRIFEKSDGDLSTHFAALGADIDAETGFTHTTFTCSTPPEQVNACLGLLARLVGEPHFSDAAVPREREIIQREIDLYEDSIDWVAFHTAVRALYGDQAVADDIAGTAQSLQRIDADLLTRAHRSLYRPQGVRLIVTGPACFDDLIGLCGELFGSVHPVEPPPSRRVSVPAPRRHEARLPQIRPRLLLAFGEEPPWGDPQRAMARELHLEWILDILLGGASAFFSDHYQSSLIDGDSFGSEIYVDEPFSFCLIGGDTDDPARLGETLVTALRDPETPRHIEADAERARRRAYGELVTSFEDPSSVTDFIEAAVLRECHPFDLADLFLQTSAADLEETWSHSLRDVEPAWGLVQDTRAS